MTELSSPAAAPATPSVTKLIIDLGPLLLFVLAYVISKSPFVATGVFMLAMVAAMVFAKIKLGSIPLLLIFSGVMVLIFGGLTIMLHDQKFIQIKPSIYYATVAAILFYGGYAKRPFLKHALGDVYPELSERGWHILGRNFAWLFLGLACLNEYIRAEYSFAQWGWSKLWLFTPITFLFGLANLPMILKHSSTVGE